MKICIVGNSGEAIGSNKGSLVDACDVVIRMNDFETRGYEKDLGSQTNIVVCAFSGENKICNPNKFPDYPHKDVAGKCIFWSARKLDYDRAKRCQGILGHTNVMQPTSEQWGRAINGAYKNFWRKQPSTGLTTIEMSLDLFPNSHPIYLHGFDDKIEKTHYFDNDYLDKDYPGDPCGHNWLGEWEYIQQYIESNNLRIL